MKGFIDSEWRGQDVHLYEHEREQREVCQRTRGAAIHCLDVPEALAECKSKLTLTIWSNLHRLAVSK